MEPTDRLRRYMRVRYHGTRKDTHSASMCAATYSENVQRQLDEEFRDFYHENVEDRMGSFVSYTGRLSDSDRKEPWSLDIEIFASDSDAPMTEFTLDFCSTCGAYNSTLQDLRMSRPDCSMCDFFCRVYESCVLTGDATQIHGEGEIICQMSCHLFIQTWPIALSYHRDSYLVLGKIELSEWIPFLFSVLIYSLSSTARKDGVAISTGFSADHTRFLGLAPKTGDIATRGSVLGQSEETSKVVSEWLRDCDCYHETVNIANNMPTRLLEISGPLLTPQVRLREKQDGYSNKGTRYVALSHCWGPEGSPRLKTTEDNFPTRKLHIPWTEIPRTFQDAIIFTYRLGVRYLWIDSLCIIQDQISLQDWREESGKMADVYSRAYFTIIAANAPHSNAGLFRTISADMLARPCMSIETSEKLTPLVLYASKQVDYPSTVTKRRFPLLSRAWAYQEKYLSPRTIFFFKDELVWRCRSATWKEAGNGALDIYDGKMPNENIARGESVSLRSQWRRCVVEYSGLEMTFQKDRLPAIGGIAAQMHQSRDGSYYAGIWSDSLWLDLCWEPETAPDIVSTTKRAPSWSWASAPGRVSYRFPYEMYTMRGIATLVDIHCNYLSSNHVGEVTGGYLKLRAPRVKLHAQWYYNYGHEFTDLAHRGSDSPWRLVLDNVADYYNSNDEEKEPTIHGIDLNTDDVIVVQICEMDLFSQQLITVHLVLQKVPDDDTFERIGLLYYIFYSSQHDHRRSQVFQASAIFYSEVAEVSESMEVTII